jgi:hypothetical protein
VTACFGRRVRRVAHWADPTVGGDHGVDILAMRARRGPAGSAEDPTLPRALHKSNRRLCAPGGDCWSSAEGEQLYSGT